ncbi:undecaprenyldiphospho-muramoylpentapeptide beta-N-acetylglucosaminyltransferase [Paenibacillus lutrae]|uniref:UDP-N-acetylglucosamine--N-acetylmuramyl-(pentapeptide) pyrophosphoryl-undecaprenol N-acetylglucosamine transferase n=1 Tax=Paenibacillus lutrae TaxID=2078573 RepID=A0A7X3FGU3_9BACL|nr:undecaprenyldiphospho-muramoylpentapeptide beta-N-acetylglucosaminyltransferase [Paenibacillus lutrae]MVO99366.1 undecaprenyldiphospho-muramoylpentapeptide beta-N-acetylglucosaminyltransferase [Paenibacillus lutrae]
MRIVFSGGGTGGHVYPALAIGEQCLSDQPRSEFLYIGTSSGLERDIVARSGLNMPFEAVEITGFRRKLASLDNVKTVMRFLRGVQRAKGILKQYRPDAVVGTGGYVCGPVLFAAARLGIPTLIHEQNALPGLTNRFLSRYVDTVAVSFRGTEGKFPQARRVVYTGNPRATSMVKADKAKGLASLGLPQDAQLVIVVGGSRGAKAINEAMIELAPLVKALPGTHFVFGTGQSYYDSTSARIVETAGALPDNLQVLPYIHNMPEVLAASKLIVNRAGASLMAEITALGIPSILIPSPNVTDNHQEHNARSLADEGGSVMLLEKDLSGSALFDQIHKIITDPLRWEHMAKQSARMGQRDSASLVVQELNRIVRKS